MTLQVDLVSPEEILFSGDADMVICRTTDGEIAFLTGHAPFVGALGIAQVTIRRSNDPDEFAAVHGGFVEVSHNQVTILSDVAELAHQVDVLRATEALSKVEAIAERDAAYEAARRRAQVRLAVAESRQG